MFRIVKIFDDPTNGVINLRFIKHLTELSSYTELTEKERHDLFELLILIGRKLALVWQHLQNYKSAEDNLIKQAKEKPLDLEEGTIQFEPSQELFFEFDEFLVQVKSCLDYLVKVPAVSLGSQRWTLRTFGEKGKDVIRALRHNVPSEYKKKAEAVIYTLQQHQGWLEQTIEARDKINHYIDGGINFENFTVSCGKNSDEELLRFPMWSEKQSIKDFMQTIWNNLFRLCEDFVVGSLFWKIKKEYAFYHGVSNIDSTDSPWKVTSYEEYKRITAMPGWKAMT